MAQRFLAMQATYFMNCKQEVIIFFLTVVVIQVDVKHGRSTLRAMLAENVWQPFCVHIRFTGFVKDSVACMPESILVHKKAKTRPSHHDTPLCAIT